MQRLTNDGVGGGDSGGGGGVRLGRFRSAPATWLETLLEDDEDDDSLITQNQNLTQLLTSPVSFGSASPVEPITGLFEPGGSGLQRQNNSDVGYFPSTFGVQPNFHYSGSGLEVPSSVKTESQHLSKGGLSQQGSGGASAGLIDMHMEKILEDSVPCKVRAKRGCATHPRSIAERVRRTRISDRIRKLQELVPKMDKQTNTADMLDEAVEYVKFLQRQIQELTEQQRKCKCMAKE